MSQSQAYLGGGVVLVVVGGLAWLTAGYDLSMIGYGKACVLCGIISVVIGIVINAEESKNG